MVFSSCQAQILLDCLVVDKRRFFWRIRPKAGIRLGTSDRCRPLIIRGGAVGTTLPHGKRHESQEAGRSTLERPKTAGFATLRSQPRGRLLEALLDTSAARGQDSFGVASLWPSCMSGAMRSRTNCFNSFDS